jgi:hypothetical protein
LQLSAQAALAALWEASSQQPAASSQQPAASSSQQPAAASRQQAASSKQQAAGSSSSTRPEAHLHRAWIVRLFQLEAQRSAKEESMNFAIVGEARVNEFCN